MNAPTKTVETMIGERDKEGLFIAEFEGLADDSVAPAITVVDNPGEFGTGDCAPIGGMT